MSKRRGKSVKVNLELIDIEGLNEAQDEVLNAPGHVVMHGVAGTGKTFLASYLAYQAVLEDKEYERVIFVRSAVPTRQIGHLPGNISEKTDIYEKPFKAIASEIFNGRTDAYDLLKKKGAVEFISTSYIRGLNIRDSVIIIDECQNMSFQELDSLITRVGPNCLLYFCGDYRQADLKRNGLQEFFDILEDMEGSQDQTFTFVEFEVDHIVRSGLVKEYLKTKYGKESGSKQQDLPKYNT